jgi:DNA-binding response OmpR family regulator
VRRTAADSARGNVPRHARLQQNARGAPPGTKVASHAVMRRTDQEMYGPPYGRTRLLIVEDELSTVFAVREFFAHAGYDVDCASGLTDAASLLDRHTYGAVITDLHLSPKRCSDGMMVAAFARLRNPSACIVMLTGYGTERSEQEAQRCGVDMYQNKPVELAQVSAFVDLVLRGDVNPPRQCDWNSRCGPH